MQTNALSRQVALLAEPKNPLDSTMSTSSGFFVHTMKHCYATALYTTEVQALYITHACISLPHACNHERSIRKECGKWARFAYKNGRLPCARKYGNAIAIFETKPLYEKRQINSGATTILSP